MKKNKTLKPQSPVPGSVNTDRGPDIPYQFSHRKIPKSLQEISITFWECTHVVSLTITIRSKQDYNVASETVNCR